MLVMHMNAPPRSFWNGFGNFVNSYGIRLPSQISQGIKNNSTNAWSTQRSMTEPMPVNQDWEQSINEGDVMTSMDNFSSGFSAQPYASPLDYAQVTADNMYEVPNYLPEGFHAGMPLPPDIHHGQVIWNTPVHYQSPFGNQTFSEPFQHGLPQVLGGRRSNTITTQNSSGIWHDINRQPNNMDPTDAIRHTPYSVFQRHDLRTWPNSYGCGSGMLIPVPQQSTVSPHSLSLQTISSPALSHSESTTFWTPLSSPTNSSHDFLGSTQPARTSLEYVPSEASSIQEENDEKASRSFYSKFAGEEPLSEAANAPFIFTTSTGVGIDQNTRVSPGDDVTPGRSSRRRAPPSLTTVSSTIGRKAQDEFLLRARENGMSYKEIRRRGNFSEAESTLRGRLRALKKNPSERVRKPEWTPKDDELLVEKINDLSEQNWSLRSQAPWRQVSEYIWENGGSYKFGYATCRKRWEELQAIDND